MSKIILRKVMFSKKTDELIINSRVLRVVCHDEGAQLKVLYPGPANLKDGSGLNIVHFRLNYFCST